MAKNSQKWSKMAKNGQKQSKTLKMLLKINLFVNYNADKK